MSEMLRPEQWGENLRELPSEQWTRYAELRAKGPDNELAPQDFRKVIECEMALSTVDNPGINGIFDPEIELKEIRSLAHDKKEAALETFKDKLVRQRRAFMQCRLFIERTIQYDRDTDSEQLKDIGDFFADRYGFSGFSRGLVHDLIYAYEEQHKMTRAFRAKYSDDGELIKELSGVSVNTGTVQISEGPLSIDILTDRPTAERLYPVNGTAGGMSKQFRGFQTSNLKGIHYTVVVNGGPRRDVTHIHEQEHVKNKVLRDFFDLDDPENTTVPNIRTRINNEIDPEVRSELRKEELRIIRDRVLDRTKDELTAMFKDGASAYFHRFYEKNGNPYDYLKGERDEYYKNPDYAELAHEILVEEYERVIKESILAFGELRKVGNHSTDEAIALLTDMPLDRWPSTVRHLSDYVYRHGQ